jgi:hypothetical protein
MDDVITTIYSALDEEKANSLTLHQALHSQAITQEIVSLNDKAVACVLKKDYQSALQTLQVALARIMSLQAQPSQQPFFSMSNGESPIASIPLHCTFPKAAEGTGIFVVFDSALVIPHHCDFDLSCPKNRSRAMATILYNVGLVYHLEAIQRGDSSIFAHALNYYGWAYYVVETASQQYGFQDILLMLLALFNNMGHIHSSHSIDAEKTRQCLRWMQSTFANPKIKTVLLQGEYQFFFQYISMQSHRQLQMAPAA